MKPNKKCSTAARALVWSLESIYGGSSHVPSSKTAMCRFLALALLGLVRCCGGFVVPQTARRWGQNARMAIAADTDRTRVVRRQQSPGDGVVRMSVQDMIGADVETGGLFDPLGEIMGRSKRCNETAVRCHGVMGDCSAWIVGSWEVLLILCKQYICRQGLAARRSYFEIQIQTSIIQWLERSASRQPGRHVSAFDWPVCGEASDGLLLNRFSFSYQGFEQQATCLRDHMFGCRLRHYP